MATGWARSSMVVQENEVEDAVRSMWDAHREEWRNYRGLMWFLAEEYPRQWEDVRRCRTEFTTWRSMARPGRINVAMKGCKMEPLCPACANTGKWKRAMSRAKAFQRCTPKGEEPVFWQIVQTAPATGPNFPPREGNWGDEARQDVRAFAKVVFGVLKEAFGDGIGVAMSYHDVSEELWSWPHPHLDMTLNGWKLEDGKAVLTARYDFTQGGMRRWQETIKREVRAMWDYDEVQPGNVKVVGPVEGLERYIKALAYQVREVIDLRKLEYSHSQGKVWWRSYSNNFRKEEFTVDEFKHGLVEYSIRLDAWKPGRRYVDRMYGHISDGAIARTQEAMGGAVVHEDDCSCNECNRWQRSWQSERPGLDFGSSINPGD